MDNELIIFCPDCRGKFPFPADELVEEEIIECDLCAAELEVLSVDPIKIRQYNEDNVF